MIKRLIDTPIKSSEIPESQHIRKLYEDEECNEELQEAYESGRRDQLDIDIKTMGDELTHQLSEIRFGKLKLSLIVINLIWYKVKQAMINNCEIESSIDE